MLNNKKVSLSDILRDFDRGLLGKTAEELEEEAAAAPEVVQPVGAVPVPESDDESYDDEDEGVYDEDEDEDDGYDDEDDEDDEEDDDEDGCECGECDICQMHEALDDLEESQNDAIDAAQALRDMADDYIDKHDEEIVKEAALFGEIFARSACDYMGKYASQYDSCSPYEYEEARNLVKQAADEAYRYTMWKLAEGDDDTMALAAQAVSDAASAAKALVENIGGGAGAEDAEAQAGRAAAEAYNETMAQMHGGDNVATPEEQQQAAQGGYDEAMSQMQQAPQEDASAAQQMPGVAANAYDQAMGQIQDQQGQQGY